MVVGRRPTCPFVFVLAVVIVLSPTKADPTKDVSSVTAIDEGIGAITQSPLPFRWTRLLFALSMYDLRRTG